MQVSNYYKNHMRELGLDKIVAAAQLRSPSPGEVPQENISSGGKFLGASAADTSQSQTPSDELQNDTFHRVQSDSGVGKDKSNGSSDNVWMKEEYPFTTQTPAPPGAQIHRAADPRSYISLLHPGAYQSVGAGTNPRGMIISASGHTSIPFLAHPIAVMASPQPTPPPKSTSTTPENGQSSQHTDGDPSQPRYSSFRAHVPPRGSIIVHDKRMPVAIQPAPGHLAIRPEGHPFPFIPFPPGFHFAPIQQHAQATPGIKLGEINGPHTLQLRPSEHDPKPSDKQRPFSDHFMKEQK